MVGVLGAVLVEGGVLDAVAVYLADVEVLFYFGDVFAWDAVGGAPDSGWGGGMLYCMLLLGSLFLSSSFLLIEGGVHGLSMFPRVGGR